MDVNRHRLLSVELEKSSLFCINSHSPPFLSCYPRLLFLATTKDGLRDSLSKLGEML